MAFCPPESPSPRPAALWKNSSTTSAGERFKVTGNAIVTGGAGDLGSAASRALLQHGVQGLVIFDLDTEQENQLVEQLQADFPSVKVLFLKVDVTEAEVVERAVDEVARLLGSVDILLSFAATVCCVPALEVKPDQWRRTLDVNATGTFIVAQAVAKNMVAKGSGGSMIFIASISGHTVSYPQPQAPYNVSKAAVLMLKSSLASEWAVHGIRVNSISPGYMNTILNEGDGLEAARKIWANRTPMGRMGEREELCGAVLLLASNAGSYITGADIVVDGGQTVL